MPTIETAITVFARATHDRDRLFFEGVTGAEEDYGRIEIVRRTTTTRRAEGDVQRILGTPVEQDEVLATLDPQAAAHLIKTLGTALVGSLQVRPPFRAG